MSGTHAGPAAQSIEVSPEARRAAYTIRFSEEDQEWVATTSAYPSLSWLASTRGAALAGLERLIADIEGDLRRDRPQPGSP